MVLFCVNEFLVFLSSSTCMNFSLGPIKIPPSFSTSIDLKMVFGLRANHIVVDIIGSVGSPGQSSAIATNVIHSFIHEKCFNKRMAGTKSYGSYMRG